MTRAATTPRKSPFSALRHRNYRLLWAGTLVSNSGDWMDQIALNWLVVTLTGNPFHLALLNLFRATPILLFTLVGGAVADRMERRRMLMVTQSCAMVLAFGLAVLVLSGQTTLWSILAVAVARGMVVAFNLPARHSLVPELVPKEDIPNAIALNSITINVTKVLGPGLAGVTIAAFGTGVCFLINGVSFLVVLWTLARMSFPERAAPTGDTQSIGRSIREGMAFAWHDRVILSLILVALATMFFGQPYMALLTLFAHDVYAVGPKGLGLLSSCAAAGSICGALTLTLRPDWTASPRAMLVFLLALGLCLTGFANSPTVATGAPLLFLTGAMVIAALVSNNTLTQLSAPPHIRGRVLSLMLLSRGLSQLGVAAWATLSGVIGVQHTVTLAGLAIVLLAVGFFVASPLRRAAVAPA